MATYLSDRRRCRRAESGLRLESLEPRLTLSGMSLVAVGAEEGRNSSPVIQLVDATTGQVVARTPAFEQGFRGGVRVAMGDLTGDGKAEVLAASGEGRVGEIRVFEVRKTGTATSLVELPAYRTIPFGPGYRGGVAIACGDLDGNGREDIVAAMSRGRGTVKGFQSVTPTAPANDPIRNTAYVTITPNAAGFDGGASVAVGDFGMFANGNLIQTVSDDPRNRHRPDGRVEIVVGSGVDAPPKVEVYDVSVPATPRVVTTITPFTPNVRWGLAVTTGRLADYMIDDIIVSAGRNGSMQTALYAGTPGDPRSYGRFVPPGAYARPNSPIYTAPIDVDGDGRIDNIVLSQGDPGGATGLFTWRVPNGSAATTVKLPTVAAPLRIASARSAFETLASGLQQLELVRGTGKSPVLGKAVRVRYYGFFDDGTAFDSGDKVLIYGNQVPGFVQGLATMKEGGFRLLKLPANLGYGAAGKPQLDADNKPVLGSDGKPVYIIPPNTPLNFEVHLVAVQPVPAAAGA